MITRANRRWTQLNYARGQNMLVQKQQNMKNGTSLVLGVHTNCTLLVW